MIHFPHKENKKIKHVHRIVILPDYQGIGLGTKFLEIVANQYKNFDFSIITSAKNLIYALYKNKNWICKRCSKVKSGKKTKISKKVRKCTTATFKYIGDKGGDFIAGKKEE